MTLTITLTNQSADQLQMLAAYYNVSIQTMAVRAIEARLADEENLDEIKQWWEALRHAESKKSRAT